MEPMNLNRPKAEYPCSQKDLYTIVLLGWKSYDDFKADFIAFKTTYNAQLPIDQLAALAAARALPDETTREDIHKSLRLEMLPLGLICLEKWSDMSSYIEDAFAEDQYQSKRMAAGLGYFDAALREDWESMSELMSKGVLFAEAHEAELLTPGGMPATFIQDLKDAAAAFNVKMQLFLNAEVTAKVQTDAKLNANNAVYRRLKKMFRDGKKIFRKQPAIRDQFVFEILLELLGKKPGGANMLDVSGNVSMMGTGLPVKGVLVKAGDGEGALETSTDAAGNFIFKDNDVKVELTVPIMVSFPGLEPQTKMVTVIPGEDLVVNFVMSPMVPLP